MRVLVTEDEGLIRMLVCDILEEAGHACIAAADATEALALLECGAARPELLVTDYNLGPGPNGQDLAAEALRRLSGLAVVFVTGNPEAFDGYALQPGQRLLPKPFLPADLAAAVRDVVAQRRATGAEAPAGADPARGAAEGQGPRWAEALRSRTAAPTGSRVPPRAGEWLALRTA